jgi:hypothetical protein
VLDGWDRSCFNRHDLGAVDSANRLESSRTALG